MKKLKAGETSKLMQVQFLFLIELFLSYNQISFSVLIELSNQHAKFPCPLVA